jgi:hypothetical protein
VTLETGLNPVVDIALAADIVRRFAANRRLVPFSANSLPAQPSLLLVDPLFIFAINFSL